MDYWSVGWGWLFSLNNWRHIGPFGNTQVRCSAYNCKCKTGSVYNASDLVTHHCIGGSNPNACERSLASHAVYTLIQCTPILVEKAGVAPEVNLRNLL